VRPTLKVADIFRCPSVAYRADQAGSLTCGQRRVMVAIEAGQRRSVAMSSAARARPALPSIPAATVTARSARSHHAQWLADREGDLLPVPCFLVVFTVPAPIASIALQNKAVVYDILIRAAAGTVQTIASDPKHLGAMIGMTAVLHTRGQNLSQQQHVERFPHQPDTLIFFLICEAFHTC
jgi:hypothetical protein